MQGDYIPQFNESAILGFWKPDQKNADIFFVTKCVDLNSCGVIIFFKLCMTMKISMDNYQLLWISL
jgi:hypothetical protein